MSLRAGVLAGIAGICVLALLGASPGLPVFGTRLAELPAGSGKAIADRACLQCHSADLLRQQRLTEKQWTAAIAKMAGWGAELREEEKAELLAYLAKHFGPDAEPFRPVEARPFPKSRPAH